MPHVVEDAPDVIDLDSDDEMDGGHIGEVYISCFILITSFDCYTLTLFKTKCTFFYF